MERAKQLKEDRKKGGGVDESEHTFAPQINSRPSYLNKPTNDSLDLLASNSPNYSNDSMEQPLPGNKSQQAQNGNSRDNSNFHRPTPSPGSDALGNEMKKFPAREKSASNLINRPQNGQHQDYQDDHSGTYNRDRESNNDRQRDRGEQYDRQGNSYQQYNNQNQNQNRSSNQSNSNQQNYSQNYQQQQQQQQNLKSNSQKYAQSSSRSNSGPQSQAESHNTTSSQSRNIVAELSTYGNDFENNLRQESFSKKAGPGW